MGAPRQLVMPSVKPARSKRALDVVRWIESVRSRVVGHLQAEIELLSRQSTPEAAAQRASAEALLFDIEGR